METIKFILEKLTGSHLVKKFPAFYGNRRFITAFTCLSCEQKIQFNIPKLPEI